MAPALLLLGAVTIARADNVTPIFEENFNNVPVNSPTPASLANWTFVNCDGIYHGDQSNHALRVYDYAISPSVTAFSDNAVITFSYSRGNSTNGNGNLYVTLLNGGGETTTTLRTNKDYKNAVITVFGWTSETQIKFHFEKTQLCTHFAIDDLKVIPSVGVTLSENEDNSTKLQEQWSDVTLTRTLQANVWNTLCLPFDVDEATLVRALGDNQDIQLRTFDSYTDGIIRFVSATSVTAGTPFLIKLNTEVKNPVFNLVSLKTTAAASTSSNGVSMVGTYSTVNLPADDTHTALFLNAQGQLKKPTANSRQLKGLRAYFLVPVGEQLSRVIIDDETVSAIEADVVTADRPAAEGWFSLSGQQLQDEPTRQGVYVRDGKKVVIK